MNRSLDQLNTEFDALLARVNAIDGTSLPLGVKGQLKQLQDGLAGLKKTLGNVNMGFQQTAQELSTELADLRALVQKSLGITA